MTIAEQDAAGRAMDARTTRLMDAPILPLILALSWPNVLIMFAHAATGLIETWWISKLGTDALAGMALVFPMAMLMSNIANGALGGAISSSVARALGANDRQRADEVVNYALAINFLLAAIVSILFLGLGRQIYGAMGGVGGELDAALVYSNLVFGGSVLVFLMGGLTSIIRGGGNMVYPAAVTIAGVGILVVASPLLIFGWGPVPAMGIAGGGLAHVAFYAAGVVALLYYIVSGRSPVRLRWTRLRWSSIASILRIAVLSSAQSLTTSVVITGATSIIAIHLGVQALAGFGVGTRVEYVLIPLSFGIGAPIVAMVATNLAAGKRDRARRISFTGAALTFAITETIGISAALFPEAWLGLFSEEPGLVTVGSTYLRIVGPAYGFLGLGLALYFAAQGAQRLFWPVISCIVRLVLALGGGWLGLLIFGRIEALYVALALGLVGYGLTAAFGVWFDRNSEMNQRLN